MSLDSEALKDMAANRGLKLRRSRVRSPDKRGYNKFGLVDPTGAEVFGFKRGKPAAETEEIASYLRSAEVQDWKASLKELGVRRDKPRQKTSAAQPSKAPEPEPGPKLALREARKGDAERLAQLFATLGHPIDPKAVASNLKELALDGEPIIVVALGRELIGAVGLHRTVNPHKAKPVGRITVLVVAEEARGRGIGRMLVGEAERRLAKLGCGSIEVTSADPRFEAHAFYKHLGYERTSLRFAKPLSSG